MRRSVLLLLLLACVFASSATARSSHQSSYSWVRGHCHSPSWCGWQTTVNCENSGRWYDTPGQFWFGLQFDYGSMLTSVRHTGVRMSAYPPSQIVNAIWLRDHSARDPWPNCWNP